MDLFSALFLLAVLALAVPAFRFVRNWLLRRKERVEKEEAARRRKLVEPAKLKE